MSKYSDWWTPFFAEFRPAFAKVHPRTTAAEVRYILDTLKLKPGARLLDCPCGIGRVALPLARRGIHVTGVDITQAFLDELSATARRDSLPIRVVRSDMRRITFDSEFDLAVNLWTSFGYFEDESDNLLVLRRLHRALRPGGRVLLNLINRDWVITHFSPREVYRLKGMQALERRAFDYRTSTMHSVWRLKTAAKVTTCDAQLRMYAFHELDRMLAAVGFTDIRGLGALRGTPVSSRSRMMYILATRPRRPSKT